MSRSRPRHESASLARSLSLALVVTLAALAPVAARAQITPNSFQINLPGEAGENQVVVADLNGDNKPDLVIANATAQTISILLGDGKGGFIAKPDIPVAGGRGFVAVADLNGDGKPDIVSANLDYYLEVYLGDGAGGFVRSNSILLPSPAMAAAIGDVNGDGHSDIVVTNPSMGALSVILSDGVGGFTLPNTFPCGSDPEAIALGDLNGDGKLDAAVASPLASTVTVMPGDGVGGFGAPTILTLPTPPGVLAIGDLNGDRKPDLAITYPASKYIAQWMGDGAGGFSHFSDVYTGPQVPNAIAIADVDGDSYPELFASSINLSTGSLQIFHNNGSGSYSALPIINLPGLAHGVAVADLNGDGSVDAVALTQTVNGITVLFGNGSGPFVLPLTTLSAAAAPNLLRLGDVNGDGKLDIAVANFGANSVSVTLGNGAGGFGARTDFPTGTSPASVAIADVSGDSKADLVVSDDGASSVSVLLGDGAGGFGAKTDFATGNQPISVAVADVSGDGKPDIVTANNGDGTVSVLLGTGGGAFATHVDIPAGGQPNGVAIADLNGDGKPDIVTADYSTARISVLLGTGGGAFATHVDYTTGNNPISVAIGDLNGDGIPDVVTANASANTISVLLGTGGGVFAGKVDLTTGSSPTSVIIADVNGDGRPDLVATNTVGNTISILLGNGSGGFMAKNDYASTGTNPNSVGAGDLNGDGRTDLVLANKGSSTVTVMLGRSPTRVTLSVNPAIPLPGAPVTLTASVTLAPPAVGTPGASTTDFFEDGMLIGSSVFVGPFTPATLVIPNPLLVGHTLTAVYGHLGVGNTYLPSISAPYVVPSSFAPVITSVADVPNDQGGHVQLLWNASPIDHAPYDPIDQYWIWRAVPPAMAMARLARGEHLVASAASTPTPGTLMSRVESAQTTYWEFLASPGASGFPGYSYLAPTAYDSLAGSNPRTLFLVQARQSSAGLGWASAPDSGYSIDNLAPPTPAPFTGVYASGNATLSWSEAPTSDLAGFALYRGSSAGFIPGPANLVVTQPNTGYVDHTGAGFYYKLAALDIHGNASPYAVLTPAGTTDVGAPAPITFALAGVHPNPSTGASLVVEFSLAHEGHATLELIDVAGRRVVSREVGAAGIGRHTIDPAQGRALAAGLYLVRLTQGIESRTARVVVTR